MTDPPPPPPDPNEVPPVDPIEPTTVAPVDPPAPPADAPTEASEGELALPAPVAAQARGALPILADAATVPVFAPTAADRIWRWATIAFVAVLYLLNAGSFGLWDPWETHYGEVTRHMIETFDWVNPWWGYARKIGSEPIAGEWFYSKPIYIFWAECTFIKLIGYTDWALRLPQALLGAAMAASVYLAVERVASRWYAVGATAVVALSPFVYMVSRQAQTDIPFVATLTIGLMFLLAAVLGRRQLRSAAGFGWVTAAFFAFALANLLPQYAIISTDLYDPNAQGWANTIQQNGIWHVVLFYLPVSAAVLLSLAVPLWRARRAGLWGDPATQDRWVRRYLVLCAYLMLAQSTYAKGLLGFLLPGAILVLYLAVTRQWALVGRLDLARGVPLFFATVLPWYVAMFCRHGMPYYQRFFIHDHFNRVGAGVHQIDTGTFEYFVEWIGYGMWPWSAFVPLALVALLARLRPDSDDPADRAADAPTDQPFALDQLRAFAFLWFLLSFVLFTLSSTRFHHYILPGIPPLGLITGLWLREFARDRRPQARAAAVVALALIAVVTVGVMGDYQNLRSLFTYKYDRPLPENLPFDWSARVAWNADPLPAQTWGETPFGRMVGPMVANLLNVGWFRFETFWKVAGGLAACGVALAWAARTRKVGLGVVTAAAALAAFWALNYYMPSLAPHWSQKYLFEKYYEDCHLHPNPPIIEEAYNQPVVRKIGLGFVADFFDAKPKRVCREDIISWLITWRGETYYSNNEIRPLNKATQLGPYLSDLNHGKPFYVLAERGRLSGLDSKLDGESRKLRDEGAQGFSQIKEWTCDNLSNDSAYFVVGKCAPVPDDGKPAAKPAPPARPVRPASERSTSPNPTF